MAPAPNPQPTPRSTSRNQPIPIAPPTRNPLILWHLLSLDAPTVAAVWTYLIASTNRVHLPWTSIAAMATAVWLLYAGDRLLDARLLDARLLDSRLLITHPDTQEGIEARHRFHHRHRQRFRLGIGVASLLLAALLPTLPAQAIHLYLIEGSFLAGYFLLIHATSSSLRLPKELAVGLFFAAAVFIPTVSRQPGIPLPLLVPALLFAALCTLNCLYIYAWEHPATPGAAHLTTLFALRHLRILSFLVLTAALALHTQPTIAIALSTAALLAFHHFRKYFTPTTLRAAADLALLTPLLFLPWR